MVYKELLVDIRGVHIKHQPGRYRRQIFHCHPALCLRSWTLEKDHMKKCQARSRPPSLESLSGYIVRQKLLGRGIMYKQDETGVQNLSHTRDMGRQQRAEQRPGWHNTIWPAILATNSLVYTEAVHILYGSQAFSFSDTHALFVFLAALGPAPLATLRDINILGWADKRSITSEAAPAFALLPRVTNLRRLRLSCSLGHSQDWAWVNIFPPRRHERIHHHTSKMDAGTAVGACHRLPVDLVAHKVYRDCWLWLAPLFAREGMCGVRRVLRVHKRNFMPPPRTSPKPIPAFTPDMEDKMQVRFWACLEILLEGHVA